MAFLLRSLVAPLALASLCALAGCDQATVIEGRIDWRSDDGIYAVQFVAPPWEVESDDGVELRLRVQPELFGTMVNGSPPTHVFVLGPVDADVPIEALLPSDIAVDPADIAEALDESGGSTGVDLPLPLADVDLGSPSAVALAELNHLVADDGAELRRELAQREPDGPWSYEVVIAPGMTVLAYYYDDGERTIRALFGSLFDIGDGDVERMAATIRVQGNVQP
ncbi:MAG TPA: hypothetical protein VG755_30890 [Nannocystaceae bacterium]|nr:hypothetical protein [Nannocystaceae bacterium]